MLTKIIYSVGLSLKLRQSYFLDRIVKSKEEYQYLCKIDSKLFPLYLSRMEKQFSELHIMILVADCIKSNQPLVHYRRIAEYSYKNLSKFTSSQSLIAILHTNHIYNFNFKDSPKISKDQNTEIIQQTFKLLFLKKRNLSASYSFQMLKFLVAIQKLIGLDAFSQQNYRKIEFTKFKPLIICFILQLFYRNKLEDKYEKLINDLLDNLQKCQKFIPFADVHHMSYAKRIITHPRFRSVYFNVKIGLQNSMKSGPDDLKSPIHIDQEQITSRIQNFVENKYIWE